MAFPINHYRVLFLIQLQRSFKDFLLNQSVPQLLPERLMQETVVVLGDRLGASPEV